MGRRRTRFAARLETHAAADEVPIDVIQRALGRHHADNFDLR